MRAVHFILLFDQALDHFGWDFNTVYFVIGSGIMMKKEALMEFIAFIAARAFIAFSAFKES